jgi:hypothetical protein
MFDVTHFVMPPFDKTSVTMPLPDKSGSVPFSDFYRYWQQSLLLISHGKNNPLRFPGKVISDCRTVPIIVSLLQAQEYSPPERALYLTELQNNHLLLGYFAAPLFLSNPGIYWWLCG